jgi:hypothetical protein
MTPDFAFTAPNDHITVARQAIDRLQGHLGRAIGPFDATTDFTSLLIASMCLEAIDPPYPPVEPDASISLDPRADLAMAIEALMAASKAAETAQETLRLAEVAHDLRELTDSAYLGTVSTDNGDRA